MVHADPGRINGDLSNRRFSALIPDIEFSHPGHIGSGCNDGFDFSQPFPSSLSSGFCNAEIGIRSDRHFILIKTFKFHFLGYP